MKRNCKAPKRNGDDKNDAANIVIKSNDDALLLSVDSLIDLRVLDSGTSFHITNHKEVMENYEGGNFGKFYLLDGKPLNIVGMGISYEA